MLVMYFIKKENGGHTMPGFLSTCPYWPGSPRSCDLFPWQKSLVPGVAESEMWEAVPTIATHLEDFLMP